MGAHGHHGRVELSCLLLCTFLGWIQGGQTNLCRHDRSYWGSDSPVWGGRILKPAPFAINLYCEKDTDRSNSGAEIDVYVDDFAPIDLLTLSLSIEGTLTLPLSIAGTQI